MGTDIFEITVNLIKMLVIFLLMVQLVPLLVWVERRGSAFIQNRFGPNRVGPLGLIQLAADGVTMTVKIRIGMREVIPCSLPAKCVEVKTSDVLHRD